MTTTLAIRKKLIGLYVDAERESARAIGTRIAQELRGSGFGVTVCLGRPDAVQIDSGASRPEDAALIITVGGDGTLLRAARIAIEGDVPLLGINTGRLGFLTEIDEDELVVDELPRLIERGLFIDERTALQAEYEGERYFALNDVVVRKGEFARLVPFALRFDDDQTTLIPADGICVATPTGSTAYFLSAGGSLIAPSVDAFGVVPLLPHTLFSRPLIVPTSSLIAVSSDSESASAHLECDGDVLAELAPSAHVTIRRHPKTVRFARTSPLRFFERLQTKMSWGVSIKDPRR
ncbi:MAG: NAD(+)/NADH kinase [Candidatus Eremiobacteraeota bacterium]|nr:NAD(+)/NADH kinase [Candidatus Eremiobacteraeota bacterium]